MAKRKQPQSTAEQPEKTRPQIAIPRVTALYLSFASYFPSRVRAIIDGFLEFSGIWIKEINTTREGNTFNINIITEWIPGFGQPIPFHEEVWLNVADLSSGSYNVQVEDHIATFNVKENIVMVPAEAQPPVNRPQPASTNEPTTQSETSLQERAHTLGLFSQEREIAQPLIEGILKPVTLSLSETVPRQVEATITGWLAHSGQKIKEVRTIREGNTFRIDVITVERAGIHATIAIPSGGGVTIDTRDLSAGTYTVQAGDQTATFTIEQDKINLDPQPVKELQAANSGGPIAETDLQRRARALGLI